MAYKPRSRPPGGSGRESKPIASPARFSSVRHLRLALMALDRHWAATTEAS